MNEQILNRHQIARMRHNTRRRRLTVASVELITPRMKRIVFTSPELHDFVSAGYDDHIKLFLPLAPGAADMCMRDYTPRAFDPAKGSLVIDFALHEAGPATAWAIDAKAGDELEIGGPRGSTIIPDDFDWYLLVGDETALPAIGRRLETANPGVRVLTAVVVEDAREIQQFETASDWTAAWALRDRDGSDDAASLRRAIESLTLPPGEGFVWIGAEGRVARALRSYMGEHRGHPLGWMKASGYWVQGEAGASDKLG